MGIRLKDLPAEVQKRILANEPPRPRRTKYGNVRTEFDGRIYDSSGEAKLARLLKAREALGEIRELEFQPTVFLSEARIRYRPDFRYRLIPCGTQEYVEYKGKELQSWKDRKKLWTVYGPATLHVYKAQRGEPVLVETIRPKWLKLRRSE